MRGIFFAAIAFAASLLLGHRADAQCYRQHTLPVAAQTWQKPEVQQHFREKAMLAEVFAADTCGRKPHKMTEQQIESLLEDLDIPQAIVDATRTYQLSLDALYAAIYWGHAVNAARDGPIVAGKPRPIEAGSSARSK